MRDKKLLFITYDVAPLELISTQRINHLIAFFCKQGYSVNVLTSTKTPLDGPCIDYDNYRSLKSIANFYEIGNRNIHHNQHDSLHIKGSKKQSSIKTFLRNLTKNIRKHLVSLFGELVDYRTIWAIKAVCFLKQHLKHTTYDLVFSSSLPVSTHIVAYYAKLSNPSSFWISDHRDLWTKNFVIYKTIAAKIIDDYLERCTLKQADILTTVSKDFVTELKKVHKKKTIVIMNGFIKEEYTNIKPSYDYFEQSDSTISLVHAGNFYPYRDPRPLLEAVARSSHRNKIKIHFFSIYSHNIGKLISDNKYEDFCTLHQAIPRKEILKVNKAAHFNLLLGPSTPETKGIITGKLFELIAIGKPVLCIGPQKNFEASQMLKEAGLLVHWDDLNPDLLYESLLQQTKSITQVALNEAYTRDSQAKKLLAYLPNSL